MADKPKTVEIDILNEEMTKELPHWLDPIEKYKGTFDARRRQLNIERSKAIQGEKK